MPKFSIIMGGSSPNMNASSRRHGSIAGLPGLKYSETSYQMSPQEEQALRNSYMNIPGIDRATAIRLGEEAVAKSPHYRASDAAPRYGGSTPSSSFIQAVNVSPALGLASITMKNGRTYSYPISAKQAGELVNADSLGKFYNAYIKLHRGGAGTSTIPKSTDAAVVGKIIADSKVDPKIISRAASNVVANPSLLSVPMGGAALGGAGMMLLKKIVETAKNIK